MPWFSDVGSEADVLIAFDGKVARLEEDMSFRTMLAELMARQESKCTLVVPNHEAANSLIKSLGCTLPRYILDDEDTKDFPSYIIIREPEGDYLGFFFNGHPEFEVLSQDDADLLWETHESFVKKNWLVPSNNASPQSP